MISGHCFIVHADACQANVYYATTSDGEARAIKVYKTSILVFKDRDRYVSGEYRFRKGYSRRNPRKMVRLWAEKELRNYSRCAGGPCALLCTWHMKSVALPPSHDITSSDVPPQTP